MPSTVISSYVYEEASSTLTITFVTGTIYQYKAVPKEVYYAMKESFAKGIYFNEQIKGNYECERIKSK